MKRTKLSIKADKIEELENIAKELNVPLSKIFLYVPADKYLAARNEKKVRMNFYLDSIENNYLITELPAEPSEALSKVEISTKKNPMNFYSVEQLRSFLKNFDTAEALNFKESNFPCNPFLLTKDKKDVYWLELIFSAKKIFNITKGHLLKIHLEKPEFFVVNDIHCFAFKNKVIAGEWPSVIEGVEILKRNLLEMFDKYQYFDKNLMPTHKIFTNWTEKLVVPDYLIPGSLVWNACDEEVLEKWRKLLVRSK